MPHTGRPLRSPALYVAGGSTSDGQDPLFLRLPSPPSWDDRPPSARAAERRARKAYFAALDALYQGQVSDEAVDKLQRLVADVRSTSARSALEHLLRVFGFVRREESGPVLVPPAAPCARITIGVPAEEWDADRARLAERYAWPLEWLRMRRFVAGKALVIDWYPLPASSAGAREPVRSLAAARARRRYRGAA
ncbi:hypothetical protein [Roseisolibacter agri]|uniref:hypothetical protein n=1 Tax=Roseisolibacter agri TaxID=2014610 RepID=UPI0024E0A7ED|nr:hypothetical protein [Roseisolibacter agri]